MKYALKVARDENPARENAQFLGTIDLPRVEDDLLIEDIVEALAGVRDCTFYFEPLESPNSRIAEIALHTGKLSELIKVLSGEEKFAMSVALDGVIGQLRDAI